MPFIHPGIFWLGLVAVGMPIIIHLLNRRRFKVRDWAAMQFLMESVRRNRRRLRIEEIILLAVRCLVVLLVGVALARFTGCAAVNRVLPGGAASQTAVFIMDDSASMGQKLGGSTLFSAAATDMSDRIRKLPGTDKAAILLTSKPDASEAFFGLNFITDADSLAGRLASLKPSDTRANLEESLASAQNLFQGESGIKRLFLAGDFRHADLANPARQQVLRKQFADLRKAGVEVNVLDYGRPAQGNLTLEKLELLDRFVVAKSPARIGVTVRNNGPHRAQDVSVRLTARVSAGGAMEEVALPVQKIDGIDPGESRGVQCYLTCPQAGPAAVTAELPADELAADNTAYLALNVRQALRVLVVDGRPDPVDPSEGESFFFVRALDPNGDGGYGNKAEVVTPDNMGQMNFENYDLVALLNVAEFPLSADAEGKPFYPHLAALEKYVAGGGGLMIFSGDRVNLTFYNGPFHGDGGGLLPVRLGPRVGQELQRAKFFRLDPKSMPAERMLRMFAGEGAAVVDLIRFSAFSALDKSSIASLAGGSDAPGPAGALPSDGGKAKPPRVLARFNDPENSPAIIERPFGKGSVVLITTTASSRWNDWPSEEMGTYLAVMNDIVSSLARGQEQLSGLVGKPIVQETDVAPQEVKAQLKSPVEGADIRTLTPVVQDNKSVLRFDRPVEAGVYTLTLQAAGAGAKDTLYSRNVDPAEGELAPGGKAELAAAFGSEDFHYEQPGLAIVQGKSPDDKEYWRWLALAALALLATETFLGQKFGHYA